MESAYISVEEKSGYRYGQFYERHKETIYKIALEKLNGDEDLAIHVVEETFTRAFDGIRYIEKTNSFKAQAFLIANLRNVLEDVYRDARAKMGIVDPPEKEDSFLEREDFDVDQVLSRNEMVADLAKYTDKLLLKEKELLFFLFFMGFSKKDMARRFEISTDNIRVRIHKVKRKLAKLILEREGRP
ncbi:sigma-70 family RNA polymerase sigma factor [Sinanaerobacter sp. ZZT-01]|uniref:sigma-70 family RNA polymerase sigma factor n=1 Tax=Sinanaerobacter sp. ZZT-01 TaxID=3111540 RepID=UPI002D77F7BE|nr:sigma-70 family RNA polymerase sigma factor [Sinanaerobacter sp. ZZT-01]WRR93576.1 sigma-70 family RNA polymerase sigma factor [Sinanaerobacter sp. ZZT-01]